MQTAAIAYRVADFLKKHPPFHSMEETDLLALVAHGRVRFHESDEFLCWQANSYGPFLFVIQQGAVSLWEDTQGKETLRDIYGPGDIVGIERYLGLAAYPYSAKAATETVIYALRAADFEPLLTKYPRAARYVQAHVAAGALYLEAERDCIHEMYVAQLASHPEPLSCEPDDTIAEAARRMKEASATAIAVMSDRTLMGALTVNDLLGWIAEGGTASEPVSALVHSAPTPVAPQSTVSDCVLAMGNSGSDVLALTADGTHNGGILRLISAEDLQPAFGDNPAQLLHSIIRANAPEALNELHVRAQAFRMEHLTRPSAAEWLTRWSDQFTASVLKRLIGLDMSIAEHAGRWCWCFLGAAGRRELLTAEMPGIAIICPDPGDVELAMVALEKVHSLLIECGYLPRPATESEDQGLIASLETWSARFENWIDDPVLNRAYECRAFLDLRPVFGLQSAWRSLEESVSHSLSAHSVFLRVLAHDCETKMPPLTLLQDGVLDDSGERTDVFELQFRALGPLVDAGRVLGFANGTVLGASTGERFASARSRLLSHDSVFREAIDALHLLLYIQGRAGLRLRTAGDAISASQLSRFDRQTLKTGFRSIRKMIQFITDRRWAEAF
mgnify:CR=1 FL=1